MPPSGESHRPEPARGADLERAALGAAAALEQLAGVHRDRVVAALGDRGGQVDGAGGDDDVQAVGDRVEAEGDRVALRGLDRVGEQLAQDGARAGRERRRVVRDLRVGRVARQHGQRGVEVVVVRADQVERDDRAAEQLLQLGVRGAVGAEAGAGQDQVADDEQVALALVGLAGGVRDVAAVGEPLLVRGALGLALGVAELRGVDDAVQDGRAVGGVDHVRQAGDRVDRLDGVAEVEVHVAQRAPLADGQVGVGVLGLVHPRVDLVGHRVVDGLAHQVAAIGTSGGGRGHEGSSWRVVPTRLRVGTARTVQLGLRAVARSVASVQASDGDLLREPRVGLSEARIAPSRRGTGRAARR